MESLGDLSRERRCNKRESVIGIRRDHTGRECTYLSPKISTEQVCSEVAEVSTSSSPVTTSSLNSSRRAVISSSKKHLLRKGPIWTSDHALLKEICQPWHIRVWLQVGLVIQEECLLRKTSNFSSTGTKADFSLRQTWNGRLAVNACVSTDVGMSLCPNYFLAFSANHCGAEIEHLELGMVEMSTRQPSHFPCLPVIVGNVVLQGLKTVRQPHKSILHQIR